MRYIKPGQSLRAIGAKGKPVKHIVRGRKYVLEVRERNRLVGYINNTTPRTRKPIAAEFSKGMIARLLYTRSHQVTRSPIESKRTYKINNKKRLRAQIPKSLIKEIKKNRGKAFGLRVTIKDKMSALTPFVIFKGKMREDDLKKLITSNLLLTINSRNLRISPKLIDQEKQKYIRRVSEGTIQLNFLDVKLKKKKKVKKKRLKPKDR